MDLHWYYAAELQHYVPYGADDDLILELSTYDPHETPESPLPCPDMYGVVDQEAAAELAVEWIATERWTDLKEATSSQRKRMLRRA